MASDVTGERADLSSRAACAPAGRSRPWASSGEHRDHDVVGGRPAAVGMHAVAAQDVVQRAAERRQRHALGAAQQPPQHVVVQRRHERGEPDGIERIDLGQRAARRYSSNEPLVAEDRDDLALAQRGHLPHDLVAAAGDLRIVRRSARKTRSDASHTATHGFGVAALEPLRAARRAAPRGRRRRRPPCRRTGGRTCCATPRPPGRSARRRSPRSPARANSSSAAATTAVRATEGDGVSLMIDRSLDPARRGAPASVGPIGSPAPTTLVNPVDAAASRS